MALVRGRVLIIDSLKLITGGVLGSAETSKIHAGAAENCVTVRRCRAHQVTSILQDSEVPAHVLRRGSCEQQLDS